MKVTKVGEMSWGVLFFLLVTKKHHRLSNALEFTKHFLFHMHFIDLFS